MLPSITEGLIAFTDKVDFSKITDDNMDTPALEEDPLNFLINHLEMKGKEVADKIAEARRIKEEIRK